jgi:hypothetical protein
LQAFRLRYLTMAVGMNSHPFLRWTSTIITVTVVSEPNFVPSLQKRNSGDWMATHEGSHFDSFQKLCDVTDYSIDEIYRRWRVGGREYINIEFFYPLIILQGKLFDARETSRGILLRAANHIQFRRSVATPSKKTNYQIDIIRETFLPKFIDLVDKEIDTTAKLLHRHRKVIASSLNRIASEAGAATSAEEKRKLMEEV